MSTPRAPFCFPRFLSLVFSTCPLFDSRVAVPTQLRHTFQSSRTSVVYSEDMPFSVQELSPSKCASPWIRRSYRGGILFAGIVRTQGFSKLKHHSRGGLCRPATGFSMTVSSERNRHRPRRTA